MDAKTRFIWTFGVLAWGLSTGVLFAVVMSVLDGKPFWPWLGISVVVFPAGGYVWGLLMWRWREARARGGAG